MLALCLALVIHSLLVGLIWFLLHDNDQSDPKVFSKEKRFGITLNEETDITDTIPLLTHSVAKITESKPSQAYRTTITPIQHQEPLSQIPLKPITEADRENLPFSVLHHYGESFFTLPAGEQHYIIDNLQRIRKINETVGTRLLRERPDDVDPMDNNVVEFLLNPDGTISDLSLEKNRIGTPLDELTLQTISLAHTKYPKPEQPTHIRIRVYIIIK